jgi:hypothetical protein
VWSAAAVLALLVVARIALTPLVEWRLRRALHEMRDLEGTFSRLDLSVIRLSGTVHDLRIEKLSAEGRRTPYLQVAQAQVGLYWRELIRGHAVGAAELRKPKISLVSAHHPRQEQLGEVPEIGKKLQELAPLRLDRVEVREGEVLWIDARYPERPRVWVHGIDATVENFATRDALARGEPSVLAASGTVQRSGQLSLFASADPLAKSLTFAGQAEIKGLKLVELGELLAATQDLAPTKGTLDMVARFACVDGHITGGIRPILQDPGVRQAKPGLGAKLKEILADVGIDLLSDRVPERNAVATTIPFEGDVRRPGAQLWPTVLGVIRNAFVSGLAASLTDLPPSAGDTARAARQARGGDGRGSSRPATTEEP